MLLLLLSLFAVVRDEGPITEDIENNVYRGFQNYKESQNPDDIAKLVEANGYQNSMYYAAKWYRNYPNDPFSDSICQRVLIEIGLKKETKVGKSLYYPLMIQFYAAVKANAPSEIPELMMDFAIAFYVWRPISSNGQMIAFTCLRQHYGAIESGFGLLNKVFEPFEGDDFNLAKTFRTPELTSILPNELKARLESGWYRKCFNKAP
eukprot:NODE_1324_length_1341_cov_0.250403.p1 type:complete len:206 gc:universal NODE_1324_length_1341_cov_0.250403:227-844(+)